MTFCLVKRETQTTCFMPPWLCHVLPQIKESDLERTRRPALGAPGAEAAPPPRAGYLGTRLLPACLLLTLSLIPWYLSMRIK